MLQAFIYGTLALGLSLWSCAPKAKPVVVPVATEKTPTAPTTLTPKPEVAAPPTKANIRFIPMEAQNASVAAWLDTVAARNRRIKYAKGFRVQVYVGQDRATAMAAKESLYRQYPQVEVYMTYTAPSFRLVCGDFLSRLEAQFAARDLARTFSAPLIVTAQVRIR